MLYLICKKKWSIWSKTGIGPKYSGFGPLWSWFCTGAHSYNCHGIGRGRHSCEPSLGVFRITSIREFGPKIRQSGPNQSDPKASNRVTDWDFDNPRFSVIRSDNPQIIRSNTILTCICIFYFLIIRIYEFVLKEILIIIE